MRRLVMWNIASLDGYLEGPDRHISWREEIWEPELEAWSIEQGADIGALLFGRVTYELMAGYWPDAPKSEVADYMNALPKYVFSRKLEKAAWSNTTLLKGAPAAEAARLKQEPGKDLFVFGSADLSAQILPLFDEIRIGVAPLLLGGGTPLFKPGAEKTKFVLLEVRTLSTDVALLRYAPRP
ncbi:dihydrofolate reductase family protein [Amphiplicatus metriothermophilus]|uniref:Dihydrofolate reductase n=1 Tax=Amphiplicatus metriothermophilus TaxID=1519374 RepID=A0A239PYV3_9PROT|nr:dihydrofolate reductase family protein [Amphiplicatus metriothermophilus]MBB5518232.1 dihydrofolate reductase [Amphiplicatus metriothermophilus]SNT75434.1 Dihydrofolate reductase [Amphiplicatus metriothermophilus]